MAEQIAYNMDCMEYLRTLHDNAFDLAVVDPPYGDGNSQSVHAERERERLGSTTDSAAGGTATKKYNRFGQRFDKYKSPAGGITARTNTTWDNPDRGNMVSQIRQKNYSVGHGPG